MSDKCLDLLFDPHRSQSIMEVVAIIMRFFFFFLIIYLFLNMSLVFSYYFIYIYSMHGAV